MWKFLPDGRACDVTPDRRPDAPPGGYMGISADRGRFGHVVVTTINRWEPGDTAWRTLDGGRSWEDLGARSTREVSASPFLKQGEEEAEFGHWTAGLALDPFDGRRASYTTGATVYATQDIGAPGAVHWRPWVRGIEQTAIISLRSPPSGPPLVSGFGDIGGFAHDDLSRSPPRMHFNPHLTNTNNLDDAGHAPAMQGTPTPIVSGGKLLGTRDRPDNNLLRFLLQIRLPRRYGLRNIARGHPLYEAIRKEVVAEVVDERWKRQKQDAEEARAEIISKVAAIKRHGQAQQRVLRKEEVAEEHWEFHQIASGAWSAPAGDWSDEPQDWSEQ